MEITLNQISTWIRFFIQICLIPFTIYVVHSLEDLTIKVALIQQQMELRTTVRDKQVSELIAIIQDHETRIRIMEHVVSLK